MTSTLAATARPRPPAGLTRPDYLAPTMTVPAPEVARWMRDTFVGRGALLHNPDHDHLLSARIGVLWTNAVNTTKQRAVVGMAETLDARGNKWATARRDQQLAEWFGTETLDFLITLYAPHAATCDDVSFCALVEHELYHCAQKLDRFGVPVFSSVTGLPSFEIRTHDVEEFVAVVRRYGAGAAAGETRALVQAANKPPEIALAMIDWACGTCARAA